MEAEVAVAEAVTPAPEAPAPLAVSLAAGPYKWIAIGSGIGISIEGPRGAETLYVEAVKIRPGAVTPLAEFVVENFLDVPCTEWGARYAEFIGNLGIGHAAAVVVLPRTDVILRQIELPGISAKDLDNAVRFQLDSLHPWDEGDVYASWARLSKWGGKAEAPTVLIAIARREVVDRYTTLFAEAGIKVSGFTCSAAAIYSALRLRGGAPNEPILSQVQRARVHETEPIEIYAESPARPLLSAAFGSDPDRALQLASSELRLEASHELTPLEDLFGAAHPLAYAAAMSSACPWRALSLNLLPEASRQSGSRAHWVITGVVAALLFVGIAVYLMLPGIRDASYLGTLNAEIAEIQPEATHAAEMDSEIEAVRNRTLMLRDLRRRAGRDLDVLAELTGRLAPPTWLDQLEIQDDRVVADGTAPQAAPLLGVIDGSALFEQSKFSSPPRKVEDGEAFRIEIHRAPFEATREPVVTAAAEGAQDPASANTEGGEDAANPAPPTGLVPIAADGNRLEVAPPIEITPGQPAAGAPGSPAATGAPAIVPRLFLDDRPPKGGKQ